MTSFDQPLDPGGYAWWYLDALSEDGCHGLTVIAFLGSVFSPYYARAKLRGGGTANPLNHCAVNVALYTLAGRTISPGWSMTERGSGALSRDSTSLAIGPSSLSWRENVLSIRIDEVTVPWPTRLQGVIQLNPSALLATSYALDKGGLHHWTPVAPHAAVSVSFDRPNLRWQGSGYLDSNRGSRPLEEDFVRWQWSRSALPGRRCVVFYDVETHDGFQEPLSLFFDNQGVARRFTSPPLSELRPTGWRIARSTPTEAPASARVIKTLEDGPFYARSLVQTQILGETALGVHESLSMTRWESPAVQWMLPFRMPRRP